MLLSSVFPTRQIRSAKGASTRGRCSAGAPAGVMMDAAQAWRLSASSAVAQLKAGILTPLQLIQGEFMGPAQPFVITLDLPAALVSSGRINCSLAPPPLLPPGPLFGHSQCAGRGLRRLMGPSTQCLKT